MEANLFQGDPYASIRGNERCPVVVRLRLGGGRGPAGRLEIVSRATGQKLQTWRHGGRLYVAGTPGERYSVRLVNHSGGRVLTVLSVDGVNAVTGETAAARQAGYVLSPRQSAEIRGWRKSLEDVAAFYFTALPDSYAARPIAPTMRASSVWRFSGKLSSRARSQCRWARIEAGSGCAARCGSGSRRCNGRGAGQEGNGAAGYRPRRAPERSDAPHAFSPRQRGASASADGLLRSPART